MQNEAGANVTARKARVAASAIANAVGKAKTSGRRFSVVQCSKPIAVAAILVKIKRYAVAACLEIFKRIIAEHLVFADKPAGFGGYSCAIHCAQKLALQILSKLCLFKAFFVVQVYCAFKKAMVKNQNKIAVFVLSDYDSVVGFDVLFVELHYCVAVHFYGWNCERWQIYAVADFYLVAVCHKSRYAVGVLGADYALGCWLCVSAYFERIFARDDVYFAIFNIDIHFVNSCKIIPNYPARRCAASISFA